MCQGRLLGSSVERGEEPLQIHVEGGTGATDRGDPCHGGPHQRILQRREAERNENLQQVGMPIAVNDFSNAMRTNNGTPQVAPSVSATAMPARKNGR